MSRFRWAFISLLLVLVPVDSVYARSSASILVFDQLSRPNRPVRLAVRLVTGVLSLGRRPVSGERIEFLLNDRSLGQALSGGDGMAVKNFYCSKPGLRVVTVRLLENPRYEADAVELYVACRKASDAILLVALSSLQTPPPPQIPFSPASSSAAMPEAVKVLSGLSKRYQLLYFETEDEALIPGTKDWLSRQNFPRAPLFAWPLTGDADRRTEKLVERLEDIRKTGWTNIAAGITRSKEDAGALSAMKIRTVVMAEDDDNEPLAGAKRVTDWKTVPSVLK
ncbi:MAG TPA: hypothetical protein VLY20_11895 [Nitrospiria bacterium]|nr:hypothetical protein [Nitrospiria bacterium]